MLGIPIYSSVSQVHDYVVQSDGAFDETVRGILNLKAYGQRVEIRVVIHRQNYRDLPMLANFIARNLTFVDHVALMGLEMTGFAKANIEGRFGLIPANYREELREAASLLDDHGLRTSIYNHQLCTVDRAVWPLAVRSISDWKNEYEPDVRAAPSEIVAAASLRPGRLRRVITFGRSRPRRIERGLEGLPMKIVKWILSALLFATGASAQSLLNNGNQPGATAAISGRKALATVPIRVIATILVRIIKRHMDRRDLMVMINGQGARSAVSNPGAYTVANHGSRIENPLHTNE
jgi:hypothetical protein